MSKYAYNIFNAFCSARSDDDSFLAGAASSKGGDYPDSAVQERVNMIKFVITIALLIPTAVTVSIMSLGNIVYDVRKQMYAPFFYLCKGHFPFNHLPDCTVGYKLHSEILIFIG